jgi:Asp/Glu/hydantoin racemase
MTMSDRQQARVLVFNPNTSRSVTDSFKPILSAIDLPNMEITYWTCPTGPSLIKTQADMFESASHCLSLLLEIADEFDGFLAACYADHPIVRLLQSYVGNKPVVGIFDASVFAALQLTGLDSKFGIVTTGAPFEILLADGVKRLLGGTADEQNKKLHRFGGVAASGIGAGDLDPESRERAREKVMAATTRLVRSGEVNVLCVGGVILAGMEPWIRQACEKTLGVKRGREVKIIDQLAVGAIVLNAILRDESLSDFTAALR